MSVGYFGVGEMGVCRRSKYLESTEWLSSLRKIKINTHVLILRNSKVAFQVGPHWMEKC